MEQPGFSYRLVRSRRKTVAICITRDANIEVRAPMRTPVSFVEQFLQSRSQWILRHQALARQRLDAVRADSARPPESLLLLGKVCPVVYEGPKTKTRFEHDHFCLPQKEGEALREELHQLYRSLAKEVLPPRVQALSQQTGLTPAAVKINGARGRWGSCTGKNGLNFSWRLILADPNAVDYVICHELAHIRHHDHSAAFWELVARLKPDYRQCRARLRELEQMLAAQSWL